MTIYQSTEIFFPVTLYFKNNIPICYKSRTEQCKFLRFKSWGLVPVCCYTEDELPENDDGMILPSSNCPLHYLHDDQLETVKYPVPTNLIITYDCKG